MRYQDLLLGLLAIRDDKPMPAGFTHQTIASAAHQEIVNGLTRFRVRDAGDKTIAFAPVRMSFDEFMYLGGGELAGCRYVDDSGDHGPDRPVIVYLPIEAGC